MPIKRPIKEDHRSLLQELRLDQVSAALGTCHQLYLAEGKKADRLWKRAEQSLRQLEFPESRIIHLLAKRDPRSW